MFSGPAPAQLQAGSIQLQSGSTISYIQNTLSSKKTQGPGSYVDPNGKPSFSAPDPPPFIHKVGSGIASAVTKVGNGVASAWNNGYININAGVGGRLLFLPLGINGGAKVSKQSTHYYAGVCLMRPGPDFSVTASPTPASKGWDLDVSAFSPRYVGGGVGSDGAVEAGVGMSGFSLCLNHTW